MPAFRFWLVCLLCTGTAEVELLLIPRRSSLISAQLPLNKRLFSLHQSVSNLILRAGLGKVHCETPWLQPRCTGQVPRVSTRHVSGSSLLLAQQKKHKEEQKKKIPFTVPLRNVMGNYLAPYSQIPNEDLAIQERFNRKKSEMHFNTQTKVRHPYLATQQESLPHQNPSPS